MGSQFIYFIVFLKLLPRALLFIFCSYFLMFYSFSFWSNFFSLPLTQTIKTEFDSSAVCSVYIFLHILTEILLFPFAADHLSNAIDEFGEQAVILDAEMKDIVTRKPRYGVNTSCTSIYLLMSMFVDVYVC